MLLRLLAESRSREEAHPSDYTFSVCDDITSGPPSSTDYHFTPAGINDVPEDEAFHFTQIDDAEYSRGSESSTDYHFTDSDHMVIPIAAPVTAQARALQPVAPIVTNLSSPAETPSLSRDAEKAISIPPASVAPVSQPVVASDLSDGETRTLLQALDKAIEVSRTETPPSSDSDSLQGVSMTPVKRPASLATLSFSPLVKRTAETAPLSDETAVVSVDQSTYLKSVFTSACDSMMAEESPAETSETSEERAITRKEVEECGEKVMSDEEEYVVSEEERNDADKQLADVFKPSEVNGLFSSEEEKMKS